MSYNDDYLDTLDGSTSANWTTNQYCFFKDNAFHADPGPTNAGYLCPVPTDALYDLDVRVTVSQVSGPLNYGYGLMFRYEATGSYYLFLVDSDGQAWFGTASTGKDARQQELWNPTTFHRGLNAQNTIRVVATGPSLTFYVNGEQVGHLNDSTYRRGWVGFCSGGKNLDAAFTNLQVHGNR